MSRESGSASTETKQTTILTELHSDLIYAKPSGHSRLAYGSLLAPILNFLGVKTNNF